jgi:hypothetical protein
MVLINTVLWSNLYPFIGSINELLAGRLANFAASEPVGLSGCVGGQALDVSPLT